MVHIGKLLVFLGLVIAVAGGVVWLLGRSGFRGLPGDVYYESDRVKFYFPIVSCVIASIVLTVLFSLFQWFNRK